MNELSANKERFKALVTATSDVVYRMSPDWQIMYEIDGKSFLNNTAQPIKEWRETNVHPADMDLVNAAINKAIENKDVFELEHRVLRQDNSVGWTVTRAVPILDAEGEILEWFGAASDISLRKETEFALKAAIEQAEQQKRLYEIVTSNTPDLIYVFNLDYTFTYANQALLDMWGKSADEAIGNTLLQNGYEPWHAEMHEREIDRIVLTKQPIRGEVAFPHAILGKRVYDYILNPVLDSDGNVVAISGTTRDVTERKLTELEKIRLSDDLAAINEELSATNEDLINAQNLLGGALEKLTQSEAKLRYLILNAPIAIGLLSGRGMIIDTANQKILEIWGKDTSVVGKPLIEALPELLGQPYPDILDEVFVSGIAYKGNEAHVVLEGKDLYVNFVYQPMLDTNGVVTDILVVAIDVTEQVKARKIVEQSELHFRRLADLVPAKISNILPSGEFTFFNQQWLDFGVMSFENFRDFGYQQIMHPNEIEAFRNGLALSEESGVPHVTEMRFKNTDGKYIWHLNVLSPVLDEANNLKMWVQSATDIQVFKEEEQRKNDFIGMVSHELKTPLTSLNGYLQLLHRKAKKGGDTFSAHAFEQSLKQVRQMTEMINGFLNVSRLDSGKIHIERTSFDFAELLKEIEEEHQLLYTSHDLIFHPMEKVLISADQQKIAQVVNNLVSNAVKYSISGTAVDISCEKLNGRLRVSVRDQGIGIKEEDLERLFERYYRVEQDNNISGFGIGLYLSSEIVARHKGKIWVESNFGKGSNFFFELPID